MFDSTAKEYGFIERIITNTNRYVSLFAAVIDANMPPPSVNFKEEDLSTFEITMNQRRTNMQTAQ
jgi:hypothetical protein